jgi:hypothetical protein
MTQADGAWSWSWTMKSGKRPIIGDLHDKRKRKEQICPFLF